MGRGWQRLAVFEDATMNELVMKHDAGDEISLSDAEYIAVLAEKRAALLRLLKTALLAGDDALWSWLAPLAGSNPDRRPNNESRHRLSGTHAGHRPDSPV